MRLGSCMAAPGKKRPITRRARAVDDKDARRLVILDAALRLFESHPYAKLSMEAVARAAKLSKGTVYLYFTTKEQLFLAALRELLRAWFTAVDDALAPFGEPLSASQLLEVFSATLSQRDTLVRMLTDVGAVEHHVGFEAAMQHKLWLLGRLTRTGTRLEARFLALRRNEGPRVLLHLYALIVGTSRLTETSPTVARALGALLPEGALYQFEEELRFVVYHYLNGLQNRGDAAPLPLEVGAGAGRGSRS